MKEVIIFCSYFLTVGSIAGMATFLMYHKIDGWGWLLFMLFCLLNVHLKSGE